MSAENSIAADVGQDTSETFESFESFEAIGLDASLTVKDLHASLAWYRDVLGFAVGNQYERDGQLRAVALRAGNVWILIGQDDGAKGWDRVKGEGFSLRLRTEQSIDDLAGRIRDRGGVLATEPTSTPWGRMFQIRDPDGFRLTIASAQ